MALPTRKAAPTVTNINTATADFTLDYPASSGIDEGDLMVACFCLGRENESDPYFTSVTDDGANAWTEAVQYTHVNGDTIVGVYYKIADADDAAGTNTAVTAVPNDTALRKTGLVMLFTGFNPVTPINVTGEYSTTTAAVDPAVIPAVTTDENDCYVFVWYSENVPWVFSSITTSGWTLDTTASASSSSRGLLFTKDSGQPTAGSTGDLELDLTSTSKLVAVTVAIEPGAAAPVLSSATQNTPTLPSTTTASVSTDTASGTLYYYWSTNSSETVATIKASGETQAVTGSGTQNVSVAATPGATGYVHFVHNNTDDSAAASTGSQTQPAAYTESAVYAGGTPPDDSIVALYTGTHTGANNASILTDGSKTFTVDALIGAGLDNETDASSTTVTDNDATTVTGTLAGGTDNDWDTNDAYILYTPLTSSDTMYCEAQITSTSEAGSLKYYFFDDSASGYTKTATLTLTLTGYADGDYDVTLATDGTFTLSAVAVGDNGAGSSAQVLGGGSGGWYYKYSNARRKLKRRMRRNARR